MSKAIDAVTIHHIAEAKNKMDLAITDVLKLVEVLREEIDWDTITDDDISKYNYHIDILRCQAETLLGFVPVKVHRCKNCGNIFFSGSNSECCNVWDPTGTRCCTTTDMPAPYKTWKCPPRKLNQQEEK